MKYEIHIIYNSNRYKFLIYRKVSQLYLLWFHVQSTRHTQVSLRGLVHHKGFISAPLEFRFIHIYVIQRRCVNRCISRGLVVEMYRCYIINAVIILLHDFTDVIWRQMRQSLVVTTLEN